MHKLSIPLSLARVIVFVGLVGVAAAATYDLLLVAIALVLATLLCSARLIRPSQNGLTAAAILLGSSATLAWPKIAPFMALAAYFLVRPARPGEVQAGCIR